MRGEIEREKERRGRERYNKLKEGRNRESGRGWMGWVGGTAVFVSAPSASLLLANLDQSLSPPSKISCPPLSHHRLGLRHLERRKIVNSVA